jgi:hypothetical protein
LFRRFVDRYIDTVEVWAYGPRAVVLNMAGPLGVEGDGSGAGTGIEQTLSHLESIPDDIFSNIVSHLDTHSLLALEASQTLRSRVSFLATSEEPS